MTYYSTNSKKYITANYRQLAEHQRMLSLLEKEFNEMDVELVDYGEDCNLEPDEKQYTLWLKHLRSYKSGIYSIRSIRALYQKYYKAKMSEADFAEEVFFQLVWGKLVLTTEAQIEKLHGGKRFAL